MSESVDMVAWGEFVQTKAGQLALLTKSYRIIAQAYLKWWRQMGAILESEL